MVQCSGAVVGLGLLVLVVQVWRLLLVLVVQVWRLLLVLVVQVCPRASGQILYL